MRFDWLSMVRQISPAHVLFVVLLLFVALLRVVFYEYPIANEGGEGSRDYLVAHLISEHGEFPLLGPHNGLFGNYGNSALYYYVLAAPLFLYDSLFTLAILQGALFIIAVACLYYIASSMFGNAAGIIALLSFAFTSKHIAASVFVWQPYIMMPLLLMSLALLLRAHQNQSFTSLLWSVVLFCAAIAVHFAAAALLVPYVALVIFVVHTFDNVRVRLLLIALLSVMIMAILYGPNLFMFLVNEGARANISMTVSGWMGSGHVMSQTSSQLAQFAINVGGHFGMHAHLLFYRIALLTPLLIIGLWYLARYPNPQVTMYLMIISGAIVIYVFLVTLLGMSNIYHYVAPSFFLFSLLFAGIVGAGLQTFWSKVVMVSMSAIVVILSTNTSILWNEYVDRRTETPKHVEVAMAASNMKRSIEDLMTTHQYSAADFFVIQSSRNYNHYQDSAVLLIPLQKLLSEKLVTLMPDPKGSYIQTNSDDFVFLGCFSAADTPYDLNECQQTFLSKNEASYVYRDFVYHSSDFSVFLYEKK